MTITPGYAAALAPALRPHVAARVVDELVPIVQKHQIEGLIMGAAE